ncbi:unnamed protein product [Cylicostephanus goldi]|uniref:Uncharacterized protein n=1 Tax=Cylicostephanus goldi TaxID=71465 RepID=A0A3P6R959_CYLGO|nr:unnamed protein product [Cylicostephanus goldi]
MFVAWIYRWLSPAQPGRGDNFTEPRTSADALDEESLALKSRSASVDSSDSFHPSYSPEFDPDFKNAVFSSKEPLNDESNKSRPLQFGIPAICSRFNSILFGPAWTDYTVDDDQSVIIANGLLAHKQCNTTHEDHSDLENCACRENDGFAEHQISVVFTPCYSNEFEATVSLPVSYSMPELNKQNGTINNSLLHTSYTVSVQCDSQEEFSDCYSVDEESFVSSSEFPYSEKSSDPYSSPAEDGSTTFLTMPLPKRYLFLHLSALYAKKSSVNPFGVNFSSDVENTTPNGNTIMKKSKTEDNCYQGL